MPVGVYKRSKGHLRKLSLARVGKPSPSFKGKKHTEESKRLMSFAQTGVMKPAEQRKKDREEYLEEWGLKRREKAGKKGHCRIHVFEKAPCERCSKRRKRRAALGICVSCGKKAVLGKTYCELCLLRLRLFSVPKTARKDAEFAAQNFKGRCQACDTTTNVGTKTWCLDHDHKTGKFRGILCFSCNVALGHAKDSIERLLSLATYLRSRT